MSDKNYYFQKLTPIDNAELKIYEDALNFVFANDDIKNVAVSGSYSAGKSSVIETYKKTHSDISFLHISLAHFESSELSNNSSTERSKAFSEEIKLNQKSSGESDSNSSGIGLETVLEGKILNQLIHQIDPEKIPQTRFKVKKKVFDGDVAKSVVIFITFSILAVYIGFFNNWCQFVSALSVKWIKTLLLLTTNSSLLLFSGIICATIFGLVLYTVIRTQKNKNIFRRVSLQGNEIEIFEEHDDSYFDKYLNEVLYLFEYCDSDVIVFEDMDRYNVTQIFEKLREINTLINNKKRKEKKPPIRFFYLLRDSIFVSKDRTKFFDFIVPIVPVIDGSNSYDQIIEHFKQGCIYELFNENFLQGLSLYVDDMRILKNIYNEFVIYHDRIESTELDINKLLAIIVYKNIFPRDFEYLQIGMGFVHTLFESKPEFIKQEIQKIEIRIQRIEQNIILTNSEMLVSVDELDAAFLLSNRQIHAVAGNHVSTFSTRVQLIKAIKDNQNNVQVYSSNNGVQQINMTSEFQQLIQNSEYIDRKQAIERKTGNHVETLKADIQKLQYQKSIVQVSRLRDIINKENIDTIFSVNFTNEIGEENTFAEIKASSYFALIKYLVRNGFIDETYPDYMTYFYGNSLSRIDKMFLRSVTDEKPKDFSYELKNPQLVLSRLRVVDFDHVEILNFDLLCYLLETKPRNDIYMTSFLQQLMETKNYKFIGEFLEMQKETNLFVEAINYIWPSIFQCILAESGFSYAQKKQYAIDTLYYSTDADIKALNENGCLSIFISNSPAFLDIANPNINKIIAGFSLIGVRFEWINHDTANYELFAAVYENNLYQLNFAIISMMLEIVYVIPLSTDYSSKNYTLITSKVDEPLAKYVKENINHYISIFLDNCGKYITDEESSVLEILNNTIVDDDKKKDYISYLQTEVESIKKVDDQDLWSSLLQQKRVKYSEENILGYYFLTEKGLDSYLIQFINSYTDDLYFNYDSINNQFGDKSAAKFFSTIVTCDELLNQKYEAILNSLNRVYNDFSHKGIASEKVLILIKLRVIQMTVSNLIFMRENYSDHLIQFIKQNISRYIDEVINKENFDLHEMLSVLEENVDDEYKVKLLKYTTDKLTLKQKRYSDAVKLYILNHNLDVNDIQFMINRFPQESDNIKNAIRHISIEHITNIISEQFSIPFELLTELFASNQLIAERKKELFVLCLINMNEVQAKEYLRALQMNEFLSLFNQKRPKLEVNAINEQILTIFEKKHWITKFEIDKDEPEYYRAYGRKSNHSHYAS